MNAWGDVTSIARRWLARQWGSPMARDWRRSGRPAGVHLGTRSIFVGRVRGAGRVCITRWKTHGRRLRRQPRYRDRGEWRCQCRHARVESAFDAATAQRLPLAPSLLPLTTRPNMSHAAVADPDAQTWQYEAFHGQHKMAIMGVWSSASLAPNAV